MLWINIAVVGVTKHATLQERDRKNIKLTENLPLGEIKAADPKQYPCCDNARNNAPGQHYNEIIYSLVHHGSPSTIFPL